MTEIVLSRWQKEFLKINTHLTPITQFVFDSVIVQDEIKDEYDNYVCYILTKEGWVQSLNYFVDRNFYMVTKINRLNGDS